MLLVCNAHFCMELGDRAGPSSALQAHTHYCLQSAYVVGGVYTCTSWMDSVL